MSLDTQLLNISGHLFSFSPINCFPPTWISSSSLHIVHTTYWILCFPTPHQLVHSGPHTLSEGLPWGLPLSWAHRKPLVVDLFFIWASLFPATHAYQKSVKTVVTLLLPPLLLKDKEQHLCCSSSTPHLKNNSVIPGLLCFFSQPFPREKQLATHWPHIQLTCPGILSTLLGQLSF